MQLAHPQPLHWVTQETVVIYDVHIPFDHAYFRDHQVRGKRVLPGAVQLSIALEAVQRLTGEKHFRTIEEACWVRPIICQSSDTRLRITLQEQANQLYFELLEDGQLCSKGNLLDSPKGFTRTAVPINLTSTFKNQPCRRIEQSSLYQEFRSMGIDYGDYFQQIDYVEIVRQYALAQLNSPAGSSLQLSNMLDCALQSGMAISIGEHRDSLMPFSLGALHFHKASAKDISTVSVITKKDSPFRTSICLFNEDKQPLVSVFDLGVRASLF